MSSEPMTEKRLAEIRAAMREPGFPEVYKAYFQPVVDELNGVLAENERLRAENQRLGYEIETLRLEFRQLPTRCTCRDGYCLGLCPYSMSETGCK